MEKLITLIITHGFLLVLLWEFIFYCVFLLGWVLWDEGGEEVFGWVKGLYVFGIKGL